MAAGDGDRAPSARAGISDWTRRYSTAALDTILGLLLLVVYIVAIVGLAALVTYTVIRVFPTERTPKKPDGPESPSAGEGPESGGRLFRSTKRQAT